MADALRDELEQRARYMGFARVGVAEVRPLAEDAEWLRRWLDLGFNGSMQYMEETFEVRRDPRHEKMLSSARSVVVLAMPYGRAQKEAGPWPGRLASYARGRDYHNIMYKRGRRLVSFLKKKGYAARCTVDSMPAMERAWARLAGVGFIGKNCCLIVPGIGSRVFLALLLTSAQLQPDQPLKQGCGRCTLCLQRCPTGALGEERLLDARLCVSYLTGVHQGPIDEALMHAMGDWIYGCDDCQDSCPYNQGKWEKEFRYEVGTGQDANRSGEGENVDEEESGDPFLLHERWRGMDAEELLRMDAERFAAFGEGLPVRKIGREGMARNAAIALGNAGRRAQLEALREAARNDPSEVVREAAAWAVRRIQEREGWV